MTDNTLAPALLADIRSMIEEARAAVAATVNAGLTLLYWRIGQRINDEVLQGERAVYGREIVATLAQELTRAYGGGFTYSSLTRMQAFAEAFPDTQIVAIAGATIELVARQRNPAIEAAAPTRVLRRDVPNRALERAHAAPPD